MLEAWFHFHCTIAEKHHTPFFCPSRCHPQTHFSTEPPFPVLFFFQRSLPQLSDSFYFGTGDHWGIERERGSPSIHCLSLKHLSLSIFWMTSLHCFTLQDKAPVCPTSRSLCLPVSLYVSLPLSLSLCLYMHAYVFMCFFFCMSMHVQRIYEYTVLIFFSSVSVLSWHADLCFYF